MSFISDPFPTGHAGIAARLRKGPIVHPAAWVVPGATVIGTQPVGALYERRITYPVVIDRRYTFYSDAGR